MAVIAHETAGPGKSPVVYPHARAPSLSHALNENCSHGTIRKHFGRVQALTREDAGSFPFPGAFGPYRVLHQVGTGVLGPVFRARESDGDRLVAIKAFHLDLTPEQADVFGDALARVVNLDVPHPAIVKPVAAGLESGTPFLAYEYVAAESLDVSLRRDARPAAGLTWIAELAGAVDAAHARGLVHGALHLRDVLVTSGGVCATGFGVASALEHVGLGVPSRRPYTAPEVAAGRRWGPPAESLCRGGAGLRVADRCASVRDRRRGARRAVRTAARRRRRRGGFSRRSATRWPMTRTSARPR